MGTEQVILRECCVVPYRITSSGTEFCLLTPQAENRWEFPKVRLSGDSECDAAHLGQAASSAGLRGSVAADEPLGSFVASRGNETRSMQGHLMRVDHSDDSWPHAERYRRIWCLPEEARVRIRRKPLRRFIDLALQSVAQSPARPGNGLRTAK
jgi:hypothetical protein